MSARSRVLMSRVVVVGCLLALFVIGFPPAARAVFVVVDPVTGKATKFNVGGQLQAVTPTATGTSFVDPTCGNQGGTSMAIVQGSKLAGVDPTLGIVLVVSCLDNGPDPSIRARLNFLTPANGAVVKQISTTISGVVAAPSNGWAHLVHRPDKGDILGCGNDGTIYSIAYSQFSSTSPGTATLLPRPSGLPSNCAALGWDPEQDMIYLGVTGGTNIVGVHHFVDGTTTDLGNFNTPCTPSGLTVSGGVLLMACSGQSTVLRLDKNSGSLLGVNGTLGVEALAAGTKISPGLGDLACDPVTFRRDSSGKDLFRDALWSRGGINGFGLNGNGAVALEFPAFTCGLPSSAAVLAAGLSDRDPVLGNGAVPKAACFDSRGNVIDSDGDGLPDCWETGGVDFDGDGVTDLTLCVPVDTNGDGIADVTECADPNHKDLFVEINWMVNHKPDPLALSQPASVTSVQSVRAAFAAAPLTNNNPPDPTTGIRIHFQVKDSPVFLNTLADAPATSPSQKEVSELVFTPCTPPAKNLNGTLNVKSLSDAADFDAIKKLNFGTAAEQANINALNAKRLAFRYVLYAHNQTGLNQLGSTASGCSEVPGDDAAITLGSFTATTVSTCTSPACTSATHNRGTTDQQAGTLMHELGHTLGLRHGGGDNNNCKPNYLSVMSYTRQIAGSPIPSRRLDYSRVALPSLGLNEQSLLEPNGLCSLSSGVLTCDPSLSPISPFFPAADQTAFGPSVWSVVPANAPPINWNRDKTKSGSPIIETTSVSGNINNGSGGCSDTLLTTLQGFDDWHNLLYRASAALEFAGGVHTVSSAEHVDLTKEQADALFLAADLDVNGVGDAQDCGAFPSPDGGNTFPDFLCPGHQVELSPPGPLCGTDPKGTPIFCSTHRIDIKPSAPSDSTGAKTINLGTEANITVAIFSERDPTTGQLWNAATQVILNNLSTFPLTFNVESDVIPVKVNNNGSGTCSASDVADPITGLKDGIKDLKCQFPTSGLPLGKHEGVVSGFFTDPNSGQIRAFRARQNFIVVQ